jgi:hypothetical protein
MHRFNYAVAALAVIAFVSPSLAEDGPRAGPSAKTEPSLHVGGEAKRETTSGRMGNETRGSGDRAGLRVETRRGERGWDRARAEQVVIVHHRHHHHHHYHHAM